MVLSFFLERTGAWQDKLTLVTTLLVTWKEPGQVGIEAAWNALGDDEQVTAEAEFRKGLAVAVSQGLPLRLESLSCDFMTWLRAGPALVRDHPELVRVDIEDDDDTVPAAIFKHMTEGVDLSGACIAWAKAEGVR